MTDETLQSGPATLRVSPLNGGRLASLTVDGLEVLARAGDGVYHWGCFPMVPFAGRIRRGRLTWHGRTYQLPITLGNHAIHGVAVDRPWTITDRDTDRAVLRCELDTRWPWPGHVEATIVLADDRVDVRLEVHAARDPMPAWIGWHPWFRRRLARGDDVRVELDVAGMLARDVDGIPTGEIVDRPPGPWDDCFTSPSWPARLTWPGALSLDIGSDAAYAVVYDEPAATVCVEPQTAPPDAVALDRHALAEPGRPHGMDMTWTWRPG